MPFEKVPTLTVTTAPEIVEIDSTIANFIKTAFLNDASYRFGIAEAAQGLSDVCHGLAFAAGWWHDPKTGQLKERNTGELIALMHSELSEALEGDRKNKMDDHLPHRKSIEVELADCIIRIFDFAGKHQLNLGSALVEKLQYNQQRADHKPENRIKDDGKKY